MNNASLTSPRLRRTLAVLMDCEEHSTREIILKARVCAVNSIVAELRSNGIAVACRRERGVYFYRLGRAGKRRLGCHNAQLQPRTEAGESLPE